MDINTLLMAAEYLERKEREADHRYASSLPCPVITSRPDRRKSSNSHVRHQPLHGIRSSHNELEKNRRAHMKHCLENLKSLVPLSADSTRHTTLGLLINATTTIKSLRAMEQQQKALKDQLIRRQQYLLDQLRKKAGGYSGVPGTLGFLNTSGYNSSSGRAVVISTPGVQYRVRPSVSESSAASSESSLSGSTSSELDDIDVIGGSLSDEDDDGQFNNDVTEDIYAISETLIIGSL